MRSELKAARKRVGLPGFEKACRLTPENGRYKKAYKVPGTREAGEWSMLNHRANQIAS